MTLQTQLEEFRKDLQSDDFKMSIGEFANLYQDGDLILNPDFQRYFRWKDSQKSLLIESIFLQIPLPPIFIYERKDGKWEVIDGLQRLSSIFQFMNILKGEQELPLIIHDVPYLSALNEKCWNDIGGSFQRIFKRSNLSITKLKWNSENFTKYEMFKRLNRTGSPLSEQEMRNCIIIMENKPFYEWMEKLSQNEDFIATTSLSESRRNEREDLELITRYLCFRFCDKSELKNVRAVDTFLDKKIVEISKFTTFNISEEESLFRNIFRALNEQIGTDSFKRYDKATNSFKGMFLISPYEAIIFALAKDPQNLSNLKNKVISLQSDPAFSRYSGSGVNVSQRWNNLFELSEKIFNAYRKENKNFR